jgi:hypothetical protein
VGATFVAIPGDGAAKRFPDVAFDEANNVYLVVTGLQKVEARYVAPNGTPLGTVAVLTTSGARCAWSAPRPSTDAWSHWLQERIWSSGGSSVQQHRRRAATDGSVHHRIIRSSDEQRAGVAYSSASNEFLVAWTDGLNNIRGSGSIQAAQSRCHDPLAMTSLWEGFPS